MTTPDSSAGTIQTPVTLKETVQAKYGEAAKRAASGETASCCTGSSGCCGATTESWDPITANLYEQGQTA